MVAPRQWPAARVEMRRVEDLRPYPRNARRHSPQHVDQIAASIQQWGWTIPLLVDESGELIAGHGRLLAARQLGIDEVPTMVARGWTEAQRRAYVIADNQLTIAGDWDTEALKVEVRELDALGVDVGLFAFDAGELDALLGRDVVAAQQLADADEVAPVDELDLDGLGVKAGDVWQLGPHRVLCGDSTDVEQVARLLGGELADLVHADPPYGMGKASAGVANDDLHGPKLDAFQSAWLRVALAHAAPNCSAYVWGIAEDLWRWWFTAGREQFADLQVRQEVVWAKGTAIGQTSADRHGYPSETERCLFLMRGQQFLGNQNADEYWEGYEPLRAWLEQQRDEIGWANRDVNAITKTQMAGHWFGRSQFQPITREHYETLREHALGIAFVETYDEVVARFGASIEGGRAMRLSLGEAMRSTRSYFDNTHDVMSDVWTFPRVHGEERFEHATPKPVALVARALRTSCPDKGLVFEPFLGSGSTLIAAEVAGRRCFGAELQPRYAATTIRRWERHTGQKAVRL